VPLPGSRVDDMQNADTICGSLTDICIIMDVKNGSHLPILSWLALTFDEFFL